jgi:hypothetical protein
VLYHYTTVPLHVLAFFAKKVDVEMSGFSGNLSRGFSIDTIKLAKEGNEFEFHKVTLNYGSNASRVGIDMVVIDELSMDGFRVIVKNLGSAPSPGAKSSKPGAKSQREMDPQDPFGIKAMFSGKIHSLVYRKISALNGVMQFPGMEEPFRLKSAVMNNLVYSAQGFQVDSTLLESDRMDLNVPALELSGSGLFTMKDEAKITLKPAFAHALRKDWTAQLKVEGALLSGSMPRVSGYLKAFDGKGSLTLAEDGKAELTLKEINLEEWFYLTTNLKTFDFHAFTPSVPALLSGQLETSGKIKLGDLALPLHVGTTPESPAPAFTAQEDRNGIRLNANLTAFSGLLGVSLKQASTASTVAVSVPLEFQSLKKSPLPASDAQSLFFFGKVLKRLNVAQKKELTSKLQVLGLPQP